MRSSARTSASLSAGGRGIGVISRGWGVIDGRDDGQTPVSTSARREEGLPSLTECCDVSVSTAICETVTADQQEPSGGSPSVPALYLLAASPRSRGSTAKHSRCEPLNGLHDRRFA
jgi:hypothetical protein